VRRRDEPLRRFARLARLVVVDIVELLRGGRWTACCEVPGDRTAGRGVRPAGTFRQFR
jgi:hypothetical protein